MRVSVGFVTGVKLEIIRHLSERSKGFRGTGRPFCMTPRSRHPVPGLLLLSSVPLPRTTGSGIVAAASACKTQLNCCQSVLLRRWSDRGGLARKHRCQLYVEGVEVRFVCPTVWGGLRVRSCRSSCATHCPLRQLPVRNPPFWAS